MASQWVATTNKNNLVFSLKNLAVRNRVSYGGFGMLMPERSIASEDYRFGYNKGSEKDDEIAGAGNHFTTFFREGDTRLGTWWGVDPKADEQPWQSPYSYMDGNPIAKNDPDGDIAGWDNVLGGIGGLLVEYGTQVATNVYNNGGISRAAFTENINLTSIAIAAGEGFLTSGASVGKKLLVTTTAAVVDNVVQVSTTKDGFKVNVETDAKNVAKNTAIDLTVDAVAKGVTPSSKTVQKQLSKTGFNKGQVASTVKDGLKAADIDITRKINQNVKAGAEKLVKGTSGAISTTSESSVKVVTSKTKDEVKTKTDR
jgi:hypothetical protein